jgi:hypothetical protein
MRRIKRPPLRNKIDLGDAQQVRIWTRRLNVSGDEMLRLVEKVGNSITAISKEVELQKASSPMRESLPVLGTSSSTTEIITASH